MGVVSRPVVPYDLIGIGTPLQPAALLPVPGCGGPDLGPLVSVSQIEVSDVTYVVLPDVTVLAVDCHPKHIAAGWVKLFQAEEPESCVPV